ncbi:MAG: HdeD family acid-resistance protein [Verrucomicrobia bacterium]|nr:HdeD family acid-resistance protein [Verrucomicrobiota bacterium]MBU1734217.1 HdeD family acid-resistance protein [Verrucomicrobiota bacterium]MBU1855755.1 HdeD family acid-resistance protein [Verrucomicrobiota bacterium]
MTTVEGGAIREILHGAWWVMLLRGILAIILGLFAFFKPACMLIGIVQVMGVFFLLDGVLLIISAITGHTGGSRWLALLGGIFYILAGIAIFSSPLLSALVTQAFVIYLMAFFVLVTGIMRIATAMRLWKTSDHKWLLLVEGIIGIIFAVILIQSPIVSAVVLMQIVGVIAVVLAITMIIMAFGLRKLAQTM